MRAFLGVALFAAMAVALLSAGCSSTCDPGEAVTLVVNADENLNFYDGAAHAMDLYIYLINEPFAFEAADIASLRVENQAVTGGVAKPRQNVAPNENLTIPIGKIPTEAYTHVGVVTSYHDGQGAQRQVVQLTGSCKATLVLGPNGITSFKAD